MAVAQRMYARALYEAARDRDRVDVARDQLAELAAAMETTPELEAFLANPQLDPGAKASVLEEVTAGADPVVRNFVRLVAAKVLRFHSVKERHLVGYPGRCKGWA